MPLPLDIFTHNAAFDPAGDFELFLQQIPAKWAVYLMADEHDRPVQLLCVKNLRASLKRRLSELQQEGPTRKIDYRALVRHIHWRRVDSSFEADCIYLEAARQLFPETYRGMIGFRPAWFVHVNPETTYPRYIKTRDISRQVGHYFGPLEDKHNAQKLVHLMESLFDLCRDYSILTQSPNAGPCPWKQMGKCVGPCDGTISLDAYRELIAYSAKVLADPQDHVREQTRRMQQAAAELHFETAAKIKTWVDQLAQLGKSPFRHLRPQEQFNYVALQRGPRAGTAKVFLITPGTIEEITGMISEPQIASDLLRLILETVQQRQHLPLDEIAAEGIGVVTQHLFQSRQTHGVFLPLEDVDDKSLTKAYHALQKQKVPAETEGEGVTKELQAL